MDSEDRKLIEKVYLQLEGSRAEIDGILGVEEEKRPEADSTVALRSAMESLDECLERLEEATTGA